MTPMQKQYHELKRDHSDAILLFRLGDFFEAFNEDAELISSILGITLTGRGKGEKRIPMAGIPHHALKNYLPKLVEEGLKIAIADQVEEAVQGQLVDRKVTKIITAGTIIDEDSLETSRNNYIACIFQDKDTYSIAYADITTGLFRVFNTNNETIALNEIKKINPAELLTQESFDINQFKIISRFEKKEDSFFKHENNLQELKDHFKVKTLEGFGLEDSDQTIIAAGAVLRYIKENHKQDLVHIHSVSLYNYSNYMQLDSQTIENLEILYPLNTSGDQKATLFSILNECITSMGQRLLRNWVINPLVNKDMLNERLDSVEYFNSQLIISESLRNELKNIGDFERIAGKIGFNSANPKDISVLKKSLEKSLLILKELREKDIPIRLKYLTTLEEETHISQIINLVDATLVEEPSTVIGEGEVINEDFDPRIKELRNLKNNTKELLLDIQKKESEENSIPSLKVSFNKVFGYYIEVTKTHTNKVPDYFVRKQTLTNAERYITDDLKKLEDKIFSANDELYELEDRIYKELLLKIQKYLPSILQLSKNISEIDIYLNFGKISRDKRLVKPQITDENVLKIENGRHIVVEEISHNFIPNTTQFNNESIFHLLTGPNMSGKSTYIRQVALITLIAQIGCFVPADSMEFKIVDRIFTRVGASDNLAKGQSTFMLEMVETSNILNNATKDSLIILDEVGRGTSTYDGVAIAWAIVENIIEDIGSKTLFATHYHELIQLEKKYESLENYHVSVLEREKEINFQYKIKKGGTDKSYGIHVAKIAGIPPKVTKKADQILEKFEKSQLKKSKSKGISPEQIELI